VNLLKLRNNNNNKNNVVESGGGEQGPAYSSGNTVTVRSNRSVLDELKDAFWGALVGILLVTVAVPLLGANEFRQAHMWKLFGRAKEIVVPDVSSSSSSGVDGELDGCLVHVTGATSTTEKLLSGGSAVDIEPAISVKNCVKLKRTVEMYQWHQRSEEKEDSNGNKYTQYHYNKKWNSRLINS
jgi:hypothetical protein